MAQQVTELALAIKLIPAQPGRRGDPKMLSIGCGQMFAAAVRVGTHDNRAGLSTTRYVATATCWCGHLLPHTAARHCGAALRRGIAAWGHAGSVALRRGGASGEKRRFERLTLFFRFSCAAIGVCGASGAMGDMTTRVLRL